MDVVEALYKKKSLTVSVTVKWSGWNKVLLVK